MQRWPHPRSTHESRFAKPRHRRTLRARSARTFRIEVWAAQSKLPPTAGSDRPPKERRRYAGRVPSNSSTIAAVRFAAPGAPKDRLASCNALICRSRISPSKRGASSSAMRSGVAAFWNNSGTISSWAMRLGIDSQTICKLRRAIIAVARLIRPMTTMGMARSISSTVIVPGFANATSHALSNALSSIESTRTAFGTAAQTSLTIAKARSRSRLGANPTTA